MTELRHHQEVPGLKTANGYSHVVSGTGRIVVTAGQVALDEKGELVGPGDMEAQTRQVFTNLRSALAAEGATFDNVLKITCYVTDLSRLPEVYAGSDEFLDLSRPPASATVQVSALVREDFLIEVEALAIV
ncbi:RidA family protein [Kitasatospora sp. NPDC048239]|uniref:RidA family protein n=1 Tax=unclassified Kitasatospora TaxID=2633591 RepID=UPI0036DCB2E4